MPALDNQDKDILIRRYKDRLDTFGANDYRTIASGPKERHWMRFQSIIEIGDLHNAKVLDLGCGTGDLMQFLLEKEISVDYIGYDINPFLIDVARERFPDKQFEVKDILTEPFPEFDYILGQAVFNFKLQGQDNFVFVQEMLRKCFQHSNKGIAFDFLSTYADYHPEYAYPYEPEKMFSFAKKLSKRVTLRHDQPSYEFVIYIYPDFDGWNNT